MKITKREYTKQMNELTSRKAILEAYIAKIIDNEMVEKYDGLNAKHDKVAKLEQDIKDLEWRWDTRNWNGSDWNSWSLVAQNID